MNFDKGKSLVLLKAVLTGRFGKLNPPYCISAGGVPRFVPPEGGFINFLAKMADTVSRYRGGKTCATARGCDFGRARTYTPVGSKRPLGTASSGPVPRFVMHTERPNHPRTTDNPT